MLDDHTDDEGGREDDRSVPARSGRHDPRAGAVAGETPSGAKEGRPNDERPIKVATRRQMKGRVEQRRLASKHELHEQEVNPDATGHDKSQRGLPYACKVEKTHDL